MVTNCCLRVVCSRRHRRHRLVPEYGLELDYDYDDEDTLEL